MQKLRSLQNLYYTRTKSARISLYISSFVAQSLLILLTSLCVEWRSTNTSWHISVHQDMGMGYLGGAFMAYWVGHLWWAFISLNGWGTYGLNGWGSNGKLLFHLKICSKMLVFRGVPFPIIAWPHSKQFSATQHFIIRVLGSMGGYAKSMFTVVHWLLFGLIYMISF